MQFEEISAYRHAIRWNYTKQPTPYTKHNIISTGSLDTGEKYCSQK